MSEGLVLRAVADLLRLAAVGSVCWAASGDQWVAAALFALVLGGLVLPRALQSSPSLDAVYSAVVLFAAWSAVLDLYVVYAWLDVVVHAITTGLVAVIVHRVLVRASVLTPRGRTDVRRAGVGVVVTVLTLGMALGVLWEVVEWLGHTYLDERIQVRPLDTMGDLLADAFGALVAGAVLRMRSVAPDTAARGRRTHPRGSVVGRTRGGLGG